MPNLFSGHSETISRAADYGPVLPRTAVELVKQGWPDPTACADAMLLLCDEAAPGPLVDRINGHTFAQLGAPTYQAVFPWPALYNKLTVQTTLVAGQGFGAEGIGVLEVGTLPFLISLLVQPTAPWVDGGFGFQVLAAKRNGALGWAVYTTAAQVAFWIGEPVTGNIYRYFAHNIYDGNPHLLTFAVDRTANVSLYLDDLPTETASVSAYNHDASSAIVPNLGYEADLGVLSKCKYAWAYAEVGAVGDRVGHDKLWSGLVTHNSWITSNMTSTRAYHTATRLQSGKILICGGVNNLGTTLATAEVYDSTTGVCTPTTAPMGQARQWHTATLLPSGKVLIAAGSGSSVVGGIVATCELYDPTTDSFSFTANPMATARWYHAAVLLNNGLVLVCSGDGAAGLLTSAELYDPVADTFIATTGPLAVARHYPTVTMLQSGKVLVAAGNGLAGYLDSAELYDPVADTFTNVVGVMIDKRDAHRATLLPSGKVLITGGYNATPPNFLKSAEVYDPASDNFTATPDMASEHYGHDQDILLSGKVLVVGGQSVAGPETSAELYDPNTNTFISMSPLVTAHQWPRALTLLNGRFLVTGGTSGLGTLRDFLVYVP